MGERIDAGGLPPISLNAKGTAPIRTVRMIIDGQEARVASPNRQDVELQFEPDLRAGQYVYFHLTQSDGNQAWSSPLWISDL